MTDRQEIPTPSPRNGAGRAALVLGVTALAFTFIPVIGDFVAIPAAIGAVVTCFIGLDRVDATHRSDAVIGGVLGVLTLLIALVIFAAEHGV